MSGDQRVAAANAAGPLRPSRRAHPEGQFVTGEYRRARLSVVIALLLLAGTAVYLVAQERQQTWASARESVLNLALGLETSITGLLEQSTASLRHISQDLSSRPGALADPEQALTVLRDGKRLDSVSSYLGLRAADGRILAVDQLGQPVVNSDVLATIAQALAAHGTGLKLCYLVSLPHQEELYLPITLAAGAGADEPEVVFALVPVRRLLANTDSLRLIPDSFVSLVTIDGRRLVAYAPGSGTFKVIGGRASQQSLAQVGGRSSGVFLSLPSKSGLIGFARSSALPLYVGASVPIASLRRQWLAEAAAPAVVLVIGVLAVLAFAWQLRRALRRQAAYVAEQEYLAQHDTLTGLRNRDGFMLELEWTIAAAPEDEFAVLLLDLNRFKEINDTLGHAAGDRVLQEIGERLRERFGAPDTCVARLGGDELAILARGMDAARTLESLCARLQECLGRTTVPGGVELDLTASIGAAVYPRDARTPSELLRCADIAMYAAKEELSDFRRYHEVMDHFTPEMLALQSELGKALREGSLSVAYQPKVRLADGGLIGLEALARWNHPTMGPIAPSRFVPLADSTELVHAFAQHMLRAACAQVLAWGRRGYRVPVSVNISANNLLDSGFVDKVRSILDSLQLEPALLELEVTESAVMRHPDTMLKRLGEIRALGVRLSIDDFGTGYASLAYLKQLPVHTLKIDKSFITNLMEDAADQRIVRSSIQLAHSFGMSVVAEGVETAGAARELLTYGCEFAQGYYFSYPLTVAEIEAQWLEPASIASRTSARYAAPAGVP
ncbi:MAG TPA: EAL domain-containing protein [Steroidobacteraceae bacterium]|nr:EAL domain-containing protein [Steroidobacteraceae bacterium]